MVQAGATGPPATALLWKNLIGVGQVFSPRLWITLLVIIVVARLQPGQCPGRARASPFMAAILVAIALGYSLLLGPQLLRLDFRHDLPLADILKTFPLRGWQIALGEILAPVAVLAMFQWLLLLVGAGLVFYLPGKWEGLFLAIAFGAAFLLPVLDLLLLLIPNAAVLLFPSWIQTGKDSPRGIEATGQRLIFALGQMLVLAAGAPARRRRVRRRLFPAEFRVRSGRRRAAGVACGDRCSGRGSRLWA